MRINLLTDAPKHNLALMKISAYHKMLGDTVKLNEPITGEGLTYGSWLYRRLYFTDYAGGTSISFSSNGKLAWDYPEAKLPPEIQAIKPDYNLYPNNDFSLGYTWSYCPRRCSFCCVTEQCNPKDHHSIWAFHDHRFNKIRLLNNNTFSDPQWRQTFEEIWDAGLVVCDENGYDLRLLDDEKAEALKRTRFDGYVHFAWDLMEDEDSIRGGLKIARHYKLNAVVYVLIGYNTTREEDIHRCQVINDVGFDPYPMPYNGGTKADRAFKRFICLRGYRRHQTLFKAWEDYRPNGVHIAHSGV